MKHLLTLWMLALCLCVSAKETCPKVIPALQEWKGGSGKLVLPAEGSIVVAPADEAALKSVATVLAQDLKDLLDWNYTIRTGKPGKNDIYLSLMKPDKQLGKEGYVLTAGRYAGIEAPARQGVFWGTRSLLQILYNEKGELPKGVARDWPQYPSRGFMLDVGRKFFTMDFLRQYVKILSFYKLNEFQIHLNDNGFVQFFDNDWNKTYAAFRLESERFPGLTAKDGSYTKKEFTDLQRLGMEYGVNVIPEIDIPAHSLAFTHYKPEIGSDKYGMDHLDLYKEETYRFVDSLLDEYLSGEKPVFIGPDVHIGTDEYNAKEAEKFRYFTDRYLKYVEKYGKNVRMWGALRWLKGNTPVKADNVTINAWSYDWIDPNASLKDGYKIINTCDAYLYIVPAAGYYRDFLDTKWLYEQWRVGKVNPKEELPEGTPGLLGGMFAVWNDHVGNGISVKDIHHRLFPALQTLATKTWDAQVSIPYAEFDSKRQLLSEAPGVNQMGRIGKQPGLVYQDEQVLPEESLPVREIGYGYTVTFDLEAEPENNGTVLFRSPDAVFYLSDPISGLFGFARDGYLNTFNFRPYPGEKINVKVQGDNVSTSLFIDGKLIEKMDIQKRYFNAGKDSMNYVRTLVFPLEKAGAFKSRITNLKVYNEITE